MKTLFVYLTLLLLTACISIKGDFKGLYSYFGKTNRDYPGLIVSTPAGTPLATLPLTVQPQVYAVNGKQVKRCLEQYENAILFIWSSKCHGVYCYSLDAVQNECDAKGYELFIAAEYYDGADMSQKYAIKHPVFGIDTRYYKTNLVDRYLPKFIKDITGKEARNPKVIKFKNGHFERFFSDLKDLQPAVP